MQLDIATEAEKRARDRLTHEAWGHLLTIDEYCEREVRLRAHRWPREAMTTWFLRDEKDGRPLASCETFRMESWLEDPKRPGVRTFGSTHAVASVFVAPELRKQGHAAEMMKQLVARLRREDPAAHASILFSDVGVELYARAGYVARPAFDRVLDSEPGNPIDGVFRLFGDDQLETYLGKLMPPEDRFHVWPTPAQIDWYLERERIYAQKLDRPLPKVRGALAGMSSIFWMVDWKNERLQILLWEALNAQDAEALLRCARRVANQLELGEVRVWDSPLGFELPASTAGGRIEPRNGSIPMICPLNPALSPEDWRAIHFSHWV